MDPSVETEEKLRAEEEAARQRLEVMQRQATYPNLSVCLSSLSVCLSVCLSVRPSVCQSVCTMETGIHCHNCPQTVYHDAVPYYTVYSITMLSTWLWMCFFAQDLHRTFMVYAEFFILHLEFEHRYRSGCLDPSYLHSCLHANAVSCHHLWAQGKPAAYLSYSDVLGCSHR